MINEISKHCPNFDEVLSLPKEMQMIYLFSSEGPICKVVGEFCYVASKRRNEATFVYDNTVLNAVPNTSRFGRTIKPPLKLNI